MKIAVYGICKNESQFVERCLASCLEADYIVITDTGSSDDTVDKMQAYARKIEESDLPHKPQFIITTVITSPWRFDAARNSAMDLIPEDAGFCVPIDLDEVFVPGWRKGVEASANQGATRLRYWYTWSWNADGSPGVKFLQDKMHARRGYRWRYHAHETLLPDGTVPECIITNEEVQLEHYPDSTKSRSQYFALLEKAAAEWPDDDRPAYYFGRELWYRNDPRCVAELLRYLALPTARWIEERSQAYVLLSQWSMLQKDYRNAVLYAMQSVEECERRETLYQLAFVMYAKDRPNYRLALAAVEQSISMGAYSTTYLNDPSLNTYAPYDLAAVCAHRAGFNERAMAYAAKALTYAMDDDSRKRIAGNVEFYV